MGRSNKIVLEADILMAMQYTYSNRAAAKYLKVSYPVYKRFADAYIDSATGKSLFELHLGFGKKIPRFAARGRRGPKNSSGKTTHSLDNILANKVPDYPLTKLKHRLWASAYKEQKCELCGFDEMRITDNQLPLTLAFKNGDKSDMSLDNLEIICYNCYFLTVGNPWNSRKWYNSKRHHTKAPDAMRKKDMIENVEVDIDGIPTNVDTLGTYDTAELTKDELQHDTNITKEEIEQLIKKGF